MSNLVWVILAEVVSELVATGELLLAHGAPERSLHHILRLKGQWPRIVNFFRTTTSPNKCLFSVLGLRFFEHKYEIVGTGEAEG